jgi:hypothetical protein
MAGVSLLPFNSGMKRGLNGGWCLQRLPNHAAPFCSNAKLLQHFGWRTLLGLEMDVGCDGLEAHRKGSMTPEFRRKLIAASFSTQ